MSEEIKKIYKIKGLTPPKGKGMHTRKFHEIASSIMKKGGAKEPYAVAMSMLGRNKAVKKSHWQAAVDKAK